MDFLLFFFWIFVMNADKDFMNMMKKLREEDEDLWKKLVVVVTP